MNTLTCRVLPFELPVLFRPFELHSSVCERKKKSNSIAVDGRYKTRLIPASHFSNLVLPAETAAKKRLHSSHVSTSFSNENK
jgi:hypothetical protein